MPYLHGLFGILVFVALACLFSSNPRAINWRLVITGLILQIILGLLIIKVPWIAMIFKGISEAFVTLLDFSLEGSIFLFGDLAKNSQAFPDAQHSLGVIVAFQVLPTIIFFATVTAGLYYLGILQRIVYVIAWVMARTMGLSGPESLSAAGNIFLGQTEAPLLVKPFIEKMTYSELMCLMTGGMATIAGGVLAAYVSFLSGDDPVQRSIIASQLLTASIMNAPAAIVISKILVPQTEPDKVLKELKVSQETLGVNLLDALSRGAADGLKLALNVGGMLLAFIALISMVNYMIGGIGSLLGVNTLIASSTGNTFEQLSLEYIFGQIGRPLAFAMGVEWDQTLIMGSLLGKKTAINEFVAYADLARFNSEGLLSPKTYLIATYALCGFSNFSSIAIQIGGIGGMAPSQQSNLSRLGLKALLGASIACMLTATIAGAIG